MDKILRIDMGATGEPAVKIEGLGNYYGLGGRALTSTVLLKEVPPTCHPLGKENKLVIAPGLLSGSPAVNSGRLSVGCKSPLTGGIKESSAGGQAAQAMGRLGYAAIILEGNVPEDCFYKIFINKDCVKIESADNLNGLGNYAVVDQLAVQYGKKVACITIGQAGEMKMSAASIAVTDMEQRPTRHAGRGGVGAIMGAKGVKAIILDDDGTKIRSPADPKKFKIANKIFSEGLRKHPITGKGMPAFGTNMMANVINEAGAFPTHNFQTGQFSGISNIAGETLAALENDRGGAGTATHGCHRGCVIRCSGTFTDKDGNYITKQPEYETVWAHGGNCGIDDLDVIAQLDRMDDDFGLDTIEMGVAIGIAMEAGLAKFGDGTAAIKLLQEVGNGTALGIILGNGAAVTGQVLGVERVPVVKRQAIPAYDPRAIQGMGVTYATSTMGADHTAGYAVVANLAGSGVNALKPEGQLELSRRLQIATAAVDSTGMCNFVAFPLDDQADTFNAFLNLMSAFTGTPMTADDIIEFGKSILMTEREFNLAAGFTSKDDRLPGFFKNEPLEPHNITFAVQDDELDTFYNW